MVQVLPGLSQLPVDNPRPLKVVCIGAGYSGILAGIRFPQKIKNLDLTIYEKNDDIGGTWHENKYEGIESTSNIRAELTEAPVDILELPVV